MKGVLFSFVCVLLACGLFLLLGSGGDGAKSPAAVRSPVPVHPAAPRPYRVPRGAVRVRTSRQLHAALARSRRTAIVLARGSYASARPFLNSRGHDLYAARPGEAVLRAGLSLGGNEGPGGALVRGLVVDIDDPRRTVDGGAITVWGSGRRTQILDTRLLGNGVTPAAIIARRPDGLQVRRIVARRFTDFGVLVDANDVDRGILEEPFSVEDVDVAQVGRPQPGSSNGRAEACVWIGNTGSLKRVRARSCAWTGLWTGTATNRARIDGVDIDDTPTGVYVEHFTRDSIFRNLHVGSRVRVGLTAEWADPDWDRQPASIGNVIERSRFASRVAGVYLDEGTRQTTVRHSTFSGQSWGAIGDYRGSGNSYHSNDYDDIDDGARPVRRDHLSSSTK